jgi:hypothetical protein
MKCLTSEGTCRRTRRLPGIFVRGSLPVIGTLPVFFVRYAACGREKWPWGQD